MKRSTRRKKVALRGQLIRGDQPSGIFRRKKEQTSLSYLYDDWNWTNRK